jgi:hypothetical protein
VSLGFSLFLVDNLLPSFIEQQSLTLPQWTCVFLDWWRLRCVALGVCACRCVSAGICAEYRMPTHAVTQYSARRFAASCSLSDNILSLNLSLEFVKHVLNWTSNTLLVMSWDTPLTEDCRTIH